MWLLIWASLLNGFVPAAVEDFVSPISPSFRVGSPVYLPAFGILLAAAVALFAGYLLAFAVYTSYRPETSDATWVRLPFWIVVGLLMLASVPFVVGSLHGFLLGFTLCVIGLASRLVAFMQTMQQPRSRAKQQANWVIPTSWIASFGAASRLYGVLLVSYGFGWLAAVGSPVGGWVLAGALVAAVVIGLAVFRGYSARL